MELPPTMMDSPQLQETCSAVMEDHPQSPSVRSLEHREMKEIDPYAYSLLGKSLSDLSDIYIDGDASPCPVYTHEGHHLLREDEQQQYDHDNIKESREEDQHVEQQELLQRQIPFLSPAALPTACSLERKQLEPLPDLDDCNSVEGSLTGSASTTSTCAANSGEAHGMVTASAASCTTWSSAFQDSNDNSVSSCPAPNDITSGINIDQRARKEVAGTHRALDCGQPSLSTSTSSQGASQEACSHASINLKPLAVTSGAGAPIQPLPFVPPSGPIVDSNAMTSTTFPPFRLPNIVDLTYAAYGGKRARNADIDTGSKEAGKAQDGGHSRLLSSSSIQAKGQETGSNNRVNKKAKNEERLMKNREAASRSRVKKKAEKSELENRVATLSEEIDSLKQDMASLREQNSFLRGMLAANGIAHGLPPLPPIPTIRQSSGSNGGGRGRATTAVNAAVGVMGSALPVVRSVAPSSMDNEGGGGINIDQRARKEVAGTHRALDCGQPSLSTSTSSQGASQEACGHANINLKPLAVTSGAGAPIQTLPFVPPSGPIVDSNAMTSTTFPPFRLPDIVDFACVVNGWKRARNADIDSGSKEAGKAQDGGHSRLLSSSSIQAKGQETSSNNRVNKKAKNEERLMKNREAASRSRVKKKAEKSELEDRVATLSEEIDSLKQDMASLREQNSFLRGMLAANGIAHGLPPLPPIPTILQSSGSNGGGRGRANTAVNAVVGVMGSALPAVSSVAPSSMDNEGGGGSVTNPTFGNMASSRGKSGSGRRKIMSVDDYDLTSVHGHAAKEFNAGVRYVLGSEIVQFGGVVLALVVLILLLVFVAREIYNLVRRDANGRGRRMSVMAIRAFPRESRRSGSWLTRFGV